ncbi:TPA: tyrosine-protein kinase, partial [Klebsiella pneumoniae subsp. pneumoniae]|nr:tyrosine-protein kinase [Klebsiella pneumoniae subsp. pneumoniae]
MSLVKKRMDQKETDEIDVGRLVGEIIDHRKLIVSVTALLTLLSLLYAIF